LSFSSICSVKRFFVDPGTGNLLGSAVSRSLPWGSGDKRKVEVIGPEVVGT
jgi:hypothetical protein